MTEKRYFALYSEGDIYPIFFDGEEDDRELDVEEVVDLLNKTSEIERLKEEIKSLTDNLEEDYILFKRNKNAKPTKYCRECWNYETEYEEVIAFGDYETLTKISCRKGHSILDDTDATDCPDYDPKYDE